MTEEPQEPIDEEPSVGPDGPPVQPTVDGTVPAPDADDSHAGDAATEPDTAAFPEDYYVALQPLTLDLVAHQLTRLDIKFTKDTDYISASWDNFRLTVRVLAGSMLAIRILLSTAYSSELITPLQARCNWWNQTATFLKASVRLELSRSSEDADGQPNRVVTVVNLDYDMPFSVGVAPVQLQETVRAVLGNVRSFQSTAKLDALRLDPGW